MVLLCELRVHIYYFTAKNVDLRLNGVDLLLRHGHVVFVEHQDIGRLARLDGAELIAAQNVIRRPAS